MSAALIPVLHRFDRVIPWLPASMPPRKQPFQLSLFEWHDLYESEFRKLLDCYGDGEMLLADFKDKAKYLSFRVANTLERRAIDRQWRKLRKAVYLRDRGCCMVCGSLVRGDNYQFYECGHIIDRFLGGPDHINNLVAMCIACNRLKPPTRTRSEYMDWASEVAAHGLALMAVMECGDEALRWAMCGALCSGAGGCR